MKVREREVRWRTWLTLPVRGLTGGMFASTAMPQWMQNFHAGASCAPHPTQEAMHRIVFGLA
jgi:hypothetical protein